ncbi:MAG: hypothetical protein KAT90_12665 [Gammaproteobacteria bacterium]|nr:hypothetical protein [Gammaproteobacteria bacterium]
MSKTYFKKGDHNVICDRTGFKHKASEMRKEWNGLMVHYSQYEKRHEQDFVRGKKDDQSVPWTRSESTDVETDSSGWADTKTTVPSGTNNGDL